MQPSDHNTSPSAEPKRRRRLLTELNKQAIVELVYRGASRREVAVIAHCSHTTIGREAARDPDFAAQLAKAEAGTSFEAISSIRKAAKEPRYWRAAAWILERRCPEEYARRDPVTFTVDQVVALLSRLYSDVLPIVPAEKAEEFEELFEDAMEEVEAKPGCAVRKQDSPEEEDGQRTHLAPRDAHAAACETSPVEENAPATPAQNGHHRPQAEPAIESASQNGKPHEEREKYVAPKQNGSRARPRFTATQMHHPRQQGASIVAEDTICKPLPANALQRRSTNCTTAVKTAGRCNKDAQPCNGEAPRTPG